MLPCMDSSDLPGSPHRFVLMWLASLALECLWLIFVFFFSGGGGGFQVGNEAQAFSVLSALSSLNCISRPLLLSQGLTV